GGGAGCCLIWGLAQGGVPGLHVLPHLPSLDYGWAFRHAKAGLILFVSLLLFGGLFAVWIAERVEDFQRRIAQGFSALRDRSYYVTRVVPWRLSDWTLRLTAVFIFPRSFAIPF